MSLCTISFLSFSGQWGVFFVVMICFSGPFEAAKQENRVRRIERELKWMKRETNKWAVTAKITFVGKKSTQAEEWMDKEEEIMTRKKEKTQWKIKDGKNCNTEEKGTQ